MNLKRIRCLACLVHAKCKCADCNRPCCTKHYDVFFEIGAGSREVCYRCYRSLTRKDNENMKVFCEIKDKLNRGEKLFHED